MFFFSSVVKSPFGNAFYEHSRIFSDQIHTYRNRDLELAYQWDFSLDKSLRANLTFPYIYFLSIELSRCSFANLVIHDCKEEEITEDWFTEAQKVKLISKYKFMFCGRHSTKTVYPSCSNVAVEIERQQYVVMEIHMYFSVVDNKIRNIPPAPTLPRSLKCIISSVVDPVVLQIFRVVVRKFLVVTIHFEMFPELQLKVFDGPGPLSRLLLFPTNVSQTGNKQQVVTSSFQCEIHCYNCRKLAYSSSRQPIKPHIEKLLVYPGSSDDITYPDHCYSNPACLVTVETTPGFHLNLSVVDILYFGQNNTDTCSYAGLSAYESESEISTTCVKTNNRLELANYQYTKYGFQNIYSSNHSLLLVFYSFKEYGNIQLTMRISTTRCKPKPVAFCDSYDFNQLELKSRYKHTSRGKVVLLEKATEECNIVQFSLNWVKGSFFKDGNPKAKCVMTVATEHVLDFGKIAQMNVTGFIRGKFSLVCSQPTLK